MGHDGGDGGERVGRRVSREAFGHCDEGGGVGVAIEDDGRPGPGGAAPGAPPWLGQGRDAVAAAAIIANVAPPLLFVQPPPATLRWAEGFSDTPVQLEEGTSLPFPSHFSLSSPRSLPCGRGESVNVQSDVEGDDGRRRLVRFPPRQACQGAVPCCRREARGTSSKAGEEGVEGAGPLSIPTVGEETPGAS